MPDRIIPHDDPTLPPSGSRSGEGSESLLPYLKRHLAAKPKVRPQDFEPSKPARTWLGDLDPPPAKEK